MAKWKRTRLTEPGPERIDGYGDLHRIGHGGFSVVYRARHVALARDVAVKVLNVDFVDADGRRRLARETELGGRLAAHPNVVSVLDTGLTAAGRPYLAMEYYSRGSLKDRVLADGPVPAAEAAAIGAKIARALAAAHEAGILHRDIKPQNILISRYGEPALADFGTARLTAALDQSARADALTPLHAAPEVLAGREPSAESDVYSLGSALYHVLTGRAAFYRDDDTGVGPLLYRILNEPLPPLDRSVLPAALADAVERAMQRDPERRFRSAAEFGEALERSAGDAPVLVVAAEPGKAEPDEAKLHGEELHEDESGEAEPGVAEAREAVLGEAAAGGAEAREAAPGGIEPGESELGEAVLGEAASDAAEPNTGDGESEPSDVDQAAADATEPHLVATPWSGGEETGFRPPPNLAKPPVAPTPAPSTTAPPPKAEEAPEPAPTPVIAPPPMPAAARPRDTLELPPDRPASDPSAPTLDITSSDTSRNRMLAIVGGSAVAVAAVAVLVTTLLSGGTRHAAVTSSAGPVAATTARQSSAASSSGSTTANQPSSSAGPVKNPPPAPAAPGSAPSVPQPSTAPVGGDPNSTAPGAADPTGASSHASTHGPTGAPTSAHNPVGGPSSRPSSAGGPTAPPPPPQPWVVTEGPGCGPNPVQYHGDWYSLSGSGSQGCGDGQTRKQTGNQASADWIFSPGQGKSCTFTIYIPSSSKITSKSAEYQVYDSATSHSNLLKRQYMSQIDRRGGSMVLDSVQLSGTGVYDVQLYDDNDDGTTEFAGVVTATCS